MASAAAVATERVRITAHFQGVVKHPDLPLSFGLFGIKLPGSGTEITLMPPLTLSMRAFFRLNFL